ARDSWVHAATHDTVVAFEVDGLDPTGASRWSVVVVGVATEASDITPDERIGLRAALGVESDAPTERLVRISLGLVTGWRTTVPVRVGDSLPAA
ncbi:MAG: pyridoxamine 5'-phosphate oxidase family protein, partial [Acidimicrobiales bacterium]